MCVEFGEGEVSGDVHGACILAEQCEMSLMESGVDSTRERAQLGLLKQILIQWKPKIYIIVNIHSPFDIISPLQTFHLFS